MKRKKAYYEEDWLDDSSTLSLAPIFRIPLSITEVRVYKSRDAYAICPRCKNVIEFDYQLYCSNCGQCLDWSKYDDAKEIYSGWDGVESCARK